MAHPTPVGGIEHNASPFLAKGRYHVLIDPTPKTVPHIQDALQRVLRSSEFAGAMRLKGFLNYIVAETCAGRGDMILGKTIAQDVYDRGVDIDDKGLSLVKVDAGRLRRRLDDYYGGSGSADTVRIAVPRGGYCPTFDRTGTIPTTATDPEAAAGGLSPQKQPRIRLSGLVAAGLGLVVLGGLWWATGATQKPVTPASDMRDVAKRQALLSKSPSALQAVNLAGQARGLIFPPTDSSRLKATLDMFDRAIELDPSYHGGHAGAAQVLGLQALLSPSVLSRDDLIVAALQSAETAVGLRPEASWSQSAVAWMLFVTRDFARANAVSERAVAIDPDDYHTQDFDGVIALFSGNFERCLQSAEIAGQREAPGTRAVFRNTSAAASYHLGRYQDTIRYFAQAAENGDPVSQVSVAYLAAAHYRLKEFDRARALVTDFQTAWPKGRIDLVLTRIFSEARYANDVIDAFKSAGWSPP